MNEPTNEHGELKYTNPPAPPLPAFISVSNGEVTAINSLCHIVNHWASGKGWNDPKTEDQILLDHAIAKRMLDIVDITDEIEYLRKHGVDETEEGRIESMGDKEAEKIASFGLMVTELSEATEGACMSAVTGDPAMDDHCPELTSEAAEMADVVIRIAHFCGKRGIDLGEAIRIKHEYNTTRPIRHNKKA